MEFPSNEAETIILYKLIQNRLGWRIKHLQTAFPDASIENQNGKILIAEFEYLANNFQSHGHDPSVCDLIICWHNDWIKSPLPVWALEEIVNKEAKIIHDLLSVPYTENIWLRERITTLEQNLHYAILENSILRERLGMTIHINGEIGLRALHNLF